MTLDEIVTHVNLIMESKGSNKVYEDFWVYHTTWKNKFTPMSYDEVKLEWPQIYGASAKPLVKPNRILNAA